LQTLFHEYEKAKAAFDIAKSRHDLARDKFFAATQGNSSKEPEVLSSRTGISDAVGEDGEEEEEPEVFSSWSGISDAVGEDGELGEEEEDELVEEED
jgi:hypothetical protein